MGLVNVTFAVFLLRDLLRHESVSDTPNGPDAVRCFGIWFNLLSKVIDKIINCSCRTVVIRAPYSIENGLAGDHLIRVLYQIAQ